MMMSHALGRQSARLRVAGQVPKSSDRRRRQLCQCRDPWFESPQLHQEVSANRRDFPGSEIARHFRNLCAKSRSLLSVWRVQATFLGASRPKCQVANFRFQSWCSPRVGVARLQGANRGKC